VTARRIAIGLVAATVVLFVARYLVAVFTGSLSDQGGLAFSLIYGVGVVLFCVLFIFVGWAYGTGLQGMADRLDAIGGSIVVERAPESGTVVVGTVPIGGGSA
jgi:hypothetical protein